MVLRINHNKCIEIFCLQAIPVLLTALFAYTGAAKLLGHAKFVAQLENILPAALAKITAYAVPVAELGIALLLCFKRTAGLWLSAAALLFFTGYVALILSRSHLPCSCGGVIAAMGWKQHLFFNAAALLLALLSLYYNNYYAYKEVSRKPLKE